MAVFAVYIKKETGYFGEVRPFGNTYHYETAPGQTFEDQAVAEELIRLEKGVTSSDATFTGWTTWGPTDGNALANVIRASGDASGAGQGQASSGMYKEACALVVIEISRSAMLNRRRWLRKFIRVPGAPAVGIASTILSGESPLPAALQTALVNYGNDIKTITTGTEFVDLVTESGDGIPLATPAQVRPYLFTRQIGS